MDVSGFDGKGGTAIQIAATPVQDAQGRSLGVSHNANRNVNTGDEAPLGEGRPVCLGGVPRRCIWRSDLALALVFVNAKLRLSWRLQPCSWRSEEL